MRVFLLRHAEAAAGEPDASRDLTAHGQRQVAQLAKGAGAPIIGFNVRASKQARDLAEREGVEIRYYAIIYDLIDDLKGVMSGMLAPIQRETFLGNAEVLEVFDISKVGKVAGCRVSEGVVRKGARVRIDRKSTRLNSSHIPLSRMPSSA